MHIILTRAGDFRELAVFLNAVARIGVIPFSRTYPFCLLESFVTFCSLQLWYCSCSGSADRCIWTRGQRNASSCRNARRPSMPVPLAGRRNASVRAKRKSMPVGCHSAKTSRSSVPMRVGFDVDQGKSPKSGYWIFMLGVYARKGFKFPMARVGLQHAKCSIPSQFARQDGEFICTATLTVGPSFTSTNTISLICTMPSRLESAPYLKRMVRRGTDVLSVFNMRI